MTPVVSFCRFVLPCLFFSFKEVTNIRVHKRFRSMIEEYDPDLVVSVHPLCQEIPLRVMKNLKKADGGSKEVLVPFVTVVTDLGGAHPTWWVSGFYFILVFRVR